MRFSLVTFAGLLASAAVAAPASISNEEAGSLPLLEETLQDPTGILDLVKDVVPTLPDSTKPPMSTAVPEVTDVASFVDAVELLFVQVTTHTAIINATLLADTVDPKLVEVELIAIVDLIKTITLALGAVGNTIEFTDAQVTKIKDTLLALIREVVATLARVLARIDVKVLLNVVLGQLSVVLAGLVLLLENLVGGILGLVLDLIQLPVLLDGIHGLLDNLSDSLKSGHITLNI